jgi:diaminopimelate decarboxylase
LVGNICESSDFFAKNRPIQELSEGDVVAVLDTGAYGLSMATTYNMRSLPAEVWIDEALQVSVIRKRKSAEDIVREALDSD